jgi:hypothetical protein
MKSYQSDFLDRLKLAIQSCETAMLVYRKQGYESKAFRLQLKQLANQHNGVLLEDRHAFTFVLHEYSKISLHKCKERHERCEIFLSIVQEICAFYQVPANGFSELCKSGNEQFRYILLMICYFMKVGETHVLQEVGKELFLENDEPRKEYISLLEQCRQDYNSGKKDSEVIDRITESIKLKSQGYAVYNWISDPYQPVRSLF